MCHCHHCQQCWLRCRAFAWPALTSHASADVLNAPFGKEGAACFARKTGLFCWESFIPFQWRRTGACMASKQNAILARLFSKCHFALSCTRSVLREHSPWFFRKEYSVPISENISSLGLVHVAGLRHTKKSLSQAGEAPRAWNDLYSSSVPWVNCT